jgi:hypothetical protein
MKLLLLLLLGGCAIVEELGKPPPSSGVYLEADTDPAATMCGGLVNDVRVPDVPTSAGKCRFNVDSYMKNGQNTWVACNSAPNRGEACADPFMFKASK